MSTSAHEIKEMSLWSKSGPDRDRFLIQTEMERCALNDISVERMKTANPNSENGHFIQTGDELDELMSEIRDCKVQIQQFEQDSQNDLWSLIQRELDNHDAHFNNWVTEMEVMFMMFVHEADDIVHHIMRDQLSLAESIEYMLEEASTDLYPSLHLDNSQLENDVINNLTISDGLVALTVRTLHRELDALTSSHDAIFDDVIAIELSCEESEFEICRRELLENMVTSAVGCVIQHKADQNGQNAKCKPDTFQQANSKIGFIKPKNKNPLRSIMTKLRSAAAGLRKSLFACAERRDDNV